MSNLIVSTEAELNTLTAAIAAFLQGSHMHLLGSAVTIDPTTTLAACLAAESTFTGYASIALNSWTAPTIDSSGAASSTTNDGMFSNSGGSSTYLYGMFLTDYGNSKLWGSEGFGSAIEIPAGLNFNNVLTYTLLSRY